MYYPLFIGERTETEGNPVSWPQSCSLDLSLHSYFHIIYLHYLKSHFLWG